MAKKLMAILGANPYSETTYEIDLPGKGKELYAGCYSTAAIAKVLFGNARENDDCYVVVFLTNGARENNWREGDLNKGLKYELSKVVPQLDKSQRIKPVSINEGKSVQELWSIVNTLLGEINDGDEVYLDITTGFRSIPLLSLLVINLARILKSGVKIKGIYYGAFEARDISTEHTPVFDLWPMIEVADWSYAIHSFFKHGSANEISDLLEGTKGNYMEGSNRYFSNLGKLLQKFSTNIQMTRGYDLIFGYNYNNLRECINTAKTLNESYSYPVVESLIERVDNIVDNYRNNDVSNGFAAVKWCIDHNLVHQGFILLQETVITCLIAMARLNEKKYINNYELRAIFKRCLEIRCNRKCRQLSLEILNNSVNPRQQDENIIMCLSRLWFELEHEYTLYDSIKGILKAEGDTFVKNYGDIGIDDNLANKFIGEFVNKDLSRYIPGEKAAGIIAFIGKCLRGFSLINKLDNKYSCLMQEISKVRNNLAHGGFNDREISEIIEFRKRWNPNSDLLNKDISKISFIDILKDICDNMEDIVEYAR